MRQKIIINCVISVFLMSLCSFAADLEVSDVKLSATNWGPQTASIKLSNIGESFKFVLAKSEVRFVGGKYESLRTAQKAYFIEPSSNIDLTLPFDIPAGYGKIQIDIFLYDVIDTLDQIFDSQRFFTKSFPVEFQLSENLKKQIVDEIKLPKFVEDNILFDNYFSRVLLTLIYNEKTTEEIAGLCQTDTDFIKSVLLEYQESGLIIIEGSSASINFMTIDKSKAEAISPAIDKTVNNLFEIITGNYQGYDSAVVSLVAQGKLSSDKYDALDLGTILYQKYPVTMGLLLWDIIGREFVNDGKPFNIFEGSDPCNAVMGDFMYMTVGAEDYVGDSYYYSTDEPNNIVIYFGFGQHNFQCYPGYREQAKQNKHVVFEFDINNPDKVYLYNPDNVVEPLSVLMDGTIEATTDLKAEMDDVFDGTFYDTNNKGARYWCWDIVVTRLMKKLENNNILEEDDIRLYRLQLTGF